jgi:hypothetical protein
MHDIFVFVPIPAYVFFEDISSGYTACISTA